ncbi:Uma2 family endonuclease [Lusitaniella coriacea LEGE 07157]|uniref:Uma2 family endonuclease n=1 Tax=Lusitaniella coriacea LEGE 07157 TaxID=945747 RepID=A0A8J7B7F6_9CYAN|nr:Uma2 family endonuclease [Lusitaniella coriacea]MBE9115216.1 Uma2 family endonuclease [Lusitaniella coriacea LEGE 07157]
MLASAPPYQITWELLPEDFVLDDRPVDNVNQPPLAAALTESLELAGRIPENALIATNYGICAAIARKIVVKAPDWFYIPQIRVPRTEVKRSYTPHKQGDLPIVVMEFISDTDGSEYSSKRTYPPGKWFFYERVLQVPNYIIFEPESGSLEVHRLDESGQYELRSPDENNCYWLAEMELFIGSWEGKRENRAGYWLRWWDKTGELLLWGSELVQQERAAKEAAEQQANQERAAKEVAEQRLAALERRLRDAGLGP